MKKKTKKSLNEFNKSQVCWRCGDPYIVQNRDICLNCGASKKEPNLMSKSPLDAVVRLHIGMKFEYKGGTAKIMAIADNWIMARKKGAEPFTIYYKKIKQ